MCGSQGTRHFVNIGLGYAGLVEAWHVRGVAIRASAFFTLDPDLMGPDSDDDGRALLESVRALSKEGCLKAPSSFLEAADNLRDFFYIFHKN